MPAGDTKEIFRVVISDIEFLQKEWDKSVSDDSLEYGLGLRIDFAATPSLFSSRGRQFF